VRTLLTLEPFQELKGYAQEVRARARSELIADELMERCSSSVVDYRFTFGVRIHAETNERADFPPQAGSEDDLMQLKTPSPGNIGWLGFELNVIQRLKFRSVALPSDRGATPGPLLKKVAGSGAANARPSGLDNRRRSLKTIPRCSLRKMSNACWTMLTFAAQIFDGVSSPSLQSNNGSLNRWLAGGGLRKS